jgi:response regulator RpfG family c-di-GMP phosphodiesterase
MSKSLLSHQNDESKIVVLYVDDEQNNLNSFQAHFRRNKNYLILTANSAEEALAALKVVAVHIIITDQKMPNMTGVEFLEESIKRTPEPVKIVVTAHKDITPILNAFKDGLIFQYHEKPWDFSDLEKSIEEGYKVYCQKK